MISRRKVKSQGQNIDIDHTLTLCKIREEKGGKILWKLYFLKLERKWKIFVYNSWFLDNNWIYYDLLKINDQKNSEMNTLFKIIKLTNQMISITKTRI